MYGHEAGCPYLTAAGGMGQCICGLEKAFRAWLRPGSVMEGGAMERDLHDAFAAGWTSRNSAHTFTSTNTAVIGPLLTADGGIPLK